MVLSPSRYLAPAYDASNDAKLGWVRESEQEGTNFLKGCRAYEDLDKGLDIIAGIDEDPVPDSLSNVTSNRLKRQIREVVATMANLRPLWGYSSDNPEFLAASQQLNKLVYGWWLSTFADRSIRQALQWACVSTGWIYPIWDPNFWYPGRGDIRLNVYGPRDVLPIQMGKDLDIQQAYAVIIQQEVPIFRLHQEFSHLADKIVPDRQNPSWFHQRLRRAMPRFMSPVANALFGEKESATTTGPMCDVFDIYIQDFSLNTTAKHVRMGRPGTSWEYDVPFMGEDIPVSKDMLGNVVYRKATPSDCQLFPWRRRMRCLRNVVLEDGPSPWWHGKVPLIKVTVDDWPNEFLGFGLVRDVYSLQKSHTRHLRGIDDCVEKALRPDQLYDPNLIARTEVERMDPRKPGRNIPINFQFGKGFEIGPPPELPQYAFAHFKNIEDQMDYLLAIRDMTNLAKTNQIPSAESIDKILEMAGPVVTDISRGMERGLRDLGEMVKCLFYQFYDAPRKVQVLGASGLSEEDWLFEPGALVPSGIRAQSKLGQVLPDNMVDAKRAMQGCIFHITPNSLHQIQQMQRKLLYIQLWRDGRFPIDPETVAENLDIPDFGSLEAVAGTLGIPIDKTQAIGGLGRWILWQQIQLALQLQAQQIAAEQQMAMQAQAQAAGLQAVADQATSEASGGKPNGAAREGRPPSGNKPPHLQQKDSGTRSTISES